ncbi:hypothetical protein V8J88_24140 [Massilia sp. W12]
MIGKLSGVPSSGGTPLAFMARTCRKRFPICHAVSLWLAARL